MEISRTGAKTFFCHRSIMWVKAETIPQAVSPPRAVIASASIHSLPSVTYSLSLCFATFYTRHISPSSPSAFKTLNLRVSFYNLLRNLGLYLSSLLFFSLRGWHAPSTSLAVPSCLFSAALLPLFLPLVFFQSSRCPCSSLSSFAFFLPFSPLLPLSSPSLLSCSVYLSSFTVTAPSLSLYPPPISHGHTLYLGLYLCISALLSPPLCTSLSTLSLFLFALSSWWSLLL